MAYVLGLELGDSNIKLLEYKKHGSRFMINKVTRILPPQGTISDGVICDVEEVYKTIYREIKKEKYKAKEMVVVIKSSQIITRNIQMDLMPNKDLETILALQYGDHLLVDIDQYQVRYKKIEKIWEDNKTDQDLLIVALPNTIIDPLLQLARKLKMKVRSINIASDAITHFFIKEENVIVVDIGDRASNITIVSCGYGILNRVIPLGANDTKLPFIKQLESEIQKLLKFYSSRNQNNKIDKIHIVGKTHYFNEIDKQMTSSLGVLCQLGIELSLEEFKGYEKLEHQDECFAYILGIMSGVWSKKPNPTNMVPIQYKKSLRRRWSVLAVALAVILGAVGLSVLAYIPIQQIAAMEEEHEELQAKLNHELLGKIKNMMEEISEAEEEKSHIETTLEKVNTPSHVSKKTLDIITSNAPGGLVINNIIMDRFLNTVIISGEAKGVTSVAQYMVSLYNTSQFKGITHTTSHSKDKTIEYSIEIELKPFNEGDD